MGISSTHILNGPVLFSDRQGSCQELTAWCKYAILQLPLPSALFKCTKNKYCSSPKWHKGYKKYNSSSPSPSRVSATTSRLMNSTAFSPGAETASKVFCAFGTFALSQNSKRNPGHNVSKLDDKRNRIPLLQRREIVKWLQLLPDIRGGSFVTSGWLRHSSSRGFSPQQNRIKIYAEKFKHTMIRFWNAGLSQTLAQLHFQLHQENWAGLFTTYQRLIEHQLWKGGSRHQPKPVCVETSSSKKSSSQLEAQTTLERLEQRLVYSRIHSLHQLRVQISGVFTAHWEQM